MVTATRCIMYTLIVTCRLNGIDPESYLRYVIREISEWQRINRRDPAAENDAYLPRLPS
ncbi:transposase domain-containing protein [Salmonella enterica]|nr:hypothetical protein [Salmonella enterica]EAP0040614.1 hypothetical protein [Salmonella enterica]EAU0382787.1 transposase domain-containing protein [Salmonella enterica]EAZ4661891.1 transposase domain-containing protein [Salmonella enterica]EBA7870205.1 transposase domain-containing protein [Salmonella enterica]